MNLDEFVDILNSNDDMADKFEEIKYKIEQEIIFMYNKRLYEVYKSLDIYKNDTDKLNKLILDISEIMGKIKQDRKELWYKYGP